MVEGSSGTVSSSIVPLARGFDEAKRSGAEVSPAPPTVVAAAVAVDAEEGEEEEEYSFS